MEEPVYVVTEGEYEDNTNVLLTASLDRAVKRFVEGWERTSSIQIWVNEELIHEYGTYSFESIYNNYQTVYSKIKFIEENGFQKYLELNR
jgi:hypothetical protein